MTKKSELVRLELYIDAGHLAEILKSADFLPAAHGELEENEKKQISKEKNPTPVKRIFELYLEKCPELTQHTILTVTMQTAIRQRYLWVMKNKQFTEASQALEWFSQFFTLVHQTDFLCGRKNDDKRPWKADLNWLMNESNFDKILSGRY